MKQENKELLLRDLCARFPYKVKASFYGAEEEMECFDEVDGITDDYVEIGQYSLPIEAIKPYLFPLSSMTEEQRQELESLMEVTTIPVWGEILSPTPEYYDWLNVNHFDYRGLIEKDLAINATNLKIY